MPSCESDRSITGFAAAAVAQRDLSGCTLCNRAHKAIQWRRRRTGRGILRCETALLSDRPLPSDLTQLVPTNARERTAIDIHGVVGDDRSVGTHRPKPGTVHEPSVQHIIPDTLGRWGTISGGTDIPLERRNGKGTLETNHRSGRFPEICAKRDQPQTVNIRRIRGPVILIEV